MIALIWSGSVNSCAQTKNGFNLENASIEASKIKKGGPPRDGIPSLDSPKFVQSGQADYLKSTDRILGVEMNGMSKAYPIRILNWHEIVNDHFGEDPVLITYCPLCGSGMAFEARIKGRSLNFGVSGLLYNNDVLMYDRQTESLWSQLLAKAVSGPMKGTRLKQIPVTHTTWRDWKAQHPHTRVLSKDTGFDRDYGKNPYSGYGKNNKIYFPVSNKNSDYHPKDLVLGVIREEVQKAYPFPELEKAKTPFEDKINGKKVKVYFDEKNRAGKIISKQGKEIPTVTLYWFAWSAFYSNGEVYKH